MPAVGELNYLVENGSIGMRHIIYIFFSIQSMKLTAEKAGLVLEETKTLTPSAWLHFQWIHLMTCPSEGIPSIFGLLMAGLVS